VRVILVEIIAYQLRLKVLATTQFPECRRGIWYGDAQGRRYSEEEGFEIVADAFLVPNTTWKNAE
jgi:uncharacterized protein (UPF0548 family)